MVRDATIRRVAMAQRNKKFKKKLELTMSARAIRKLREDRATVLSNADEEEESEDEDHHVAAPAKKSAFVMMDDSSDEDDDEELQSNEKDSSIINDKDNGEKGETLEDKMENMSDMSHVRENDGIATPNKEENLDALLEEFKEHDEKKQQFTEDTVENTAADGLESLSAFQVLRANVDVRELDVDYVMRSSLLSAEPGRDNINTGNKNKRRNRQAFLFGNPRDLNVNVKPPHYVGGGIGMSSYDRETESNRTIPWPYQDISCAHLQDTATCQALQDRRRWFTFIHSDSYDKDAQDFMQIQASGDMNSLVLFVAHHPFVTEALVTLGMMLYQCNQAQEGLTFLRRAVWVYEVATLSSFSSRVFDDSCFMDYHQPENKIYFSALFRLARVTHMAGLSRASIAIGRYLLSLDPLRDPAGVLLALDCYALATNSDLNYQWIVDMVESQEVRA
jgi:Transcriptional repressor TCF25